MSLQAKVHTQQSKRAKPKERERKVVFQSSLDNPYRVRWPSVPQNVQVMALALLSSCLEGVSEFKKTQKRTNKPRKRPQEQRNSKRKREEEMDDEPDTKKRRIDNEETAPDTEDTPMGERTTTTEAVVVPPTPAILKHVVVGINEVAKRLEWQIRSAKTVSVPAEPLPVPRSLRIVFVCRDEVDPPELIDHIAYLCAAANTARNVDMVTVIPLPRNSESMLASALNIKRLAVVGLDCEAPGLSSFDNILSSVPKLSAPWLASANLQTVKIVPTHIKQTKTTAPKDMKAAKEQRQAGRMAAKERRKEKN